MKSVRLITLIVISVFILTFYEYCNCYRQFKDETSHHQWSQQKESPNNQIQLTETNYSTRKLEKRSRLSSHDKLPESGHFQHSQHSMYPNKRVTALLAPDKVRKKLESSVARAVESMKETAIDMGKELDDDGDENDDELDLSFYKLRIVNGERASPGEFPFIVALMDDKKKFFCGGSVIGLRLVLTAAHCVEKKSPEHILILPNYRNIKSPSTDDEIYSVGEIVRHPCFNFDLLRSDLAILVLKKQIVLTDNIGIVSLPPINHKMDQVFTVAGWGSIGFLKEGSDYLMRADVRLHNASTCKEFYDKYFLEDMICGGGGNDPETCTGDSGGPAVTEIDGKTYQVAMISWGNRCGAEGSPGVYVNLSYYHDWIANVICKYSKDKSCKQLTTSSELDKGSTKLSSDSSDSSDSSGSSDSSDSSDSDDIHARPDEKLRCIKLQNNATSLGNDKSMVYESSKKSKETAEDLKNDNAQAEGIKIDDKNEDDNDDNNDKSNESQNNPDGRDSLNLQNSGLKDNYPNENWTNISWLSNFTLPNELNYQFIQKFSSYWLNWHTQEPSQLDIKVNTNLFKILENDPADGKYCLVEQKYDYNSGNSKSFCQENNQKCRILEKQKGSNKKKDEEQHDKRIKTVQKKKKNGIKKCQHLKGLDRKICAKQNRSKKKISKISVELIKSKQTANKKKQRKGSRFKIEIQKLAAHLAEDDSSSDESTSDLDDMNIPDRRVSKRRIGVK